MDILKLLHLLVAMTSRIIPPMMWIASLLALSTVMVTGKRDDAL